jgi:hypothetical protein
VTIAYVGNFGPPHSTENHVAATLEAMGHTVSRMQEVGPYALRAEDVTARLHTADLLLWTRTPPGLKGDAPRMLRTAARMGIPSVALHLDLYAGLARGVDVAKEPWWTCQYVFTADGGSEAFWQEHGIRHHWLPPAVFGPEAYMAEPNGRRYDVIFTGQRDYHPEWKYRPQLVDWLASTYGARFRRFPMPGEHAVRGHDLNVLYASTKVVVGDSLCLGFTHPRYWSDRLPETLGRGGFLIMPEIEGLRDFYAPDELVTYTFGDFAGLREKIDYYLTHDDEREAIRRAGHEATKRHSTYTHRMEAMLKTVFPDEA